MEIRAVHGETPQITLMETGESIDFCDTDGRRVFTLHRGHSKDEWVLESLGPKKKIVFTHPEKIVGVEAILVAANFV